MAEGSCAAQVNKPAAGAGEPAFAPRRAEEVAALRRAAEAEAARRAEEDAWRAAVGAARGVRGARPALLSAEQWAAGPFAARIAALRSVALCTGRVDDATFALAAASLALAGAAVTLGLGCVWRVAGGVWRGAGGGARSHSRCGLLGKAPSRRAAAARHRADSHPRAVCPCCGASAGGAGAGPGAVPSRGPDPGAAAGLLTELGAFRRHEPLALLRRGLDPAGSHTPQAEAAAQVEWRWGPQRRGRLPLHGS